MLLIGRVGILRFCFTRNHSRSLPKIFDDLFGHLHIAPIPSGIKATMRTGNFFAKKQFIKKLKSGKHHKWPKKRTLFHQWKTKSDQQSRYGDYLQIVKRVKLRAKAQRPRCTTKSTEKIDLCTFHSVRS